MAGKAWVLLIVLVWLIINLGSSIGSWSNDTELALLILIGAFGTATLVVAGGRDD